jgi:ATP-binding cassette subfamily B protein/subfamily B ATP-binding cassette protein MsbA
MQVEALQLPRARAYARLISYAAPYRWHWASIITVSLVGTALSVLQPWPLKVLVDHVLGDLPMPPSMAAVVDLAPGGDTAHGLLAYVVVAGLVIFAISSAVDVIVSLEWTRVGRQMVYALESDLFAFAQRRALHRHARHSVGDSMSRIIGDAWCLHAVVDTLLFAPGHALLTTIVMLVVMMQLDPGLTLLAMCVAPPMTVAAWAFGRPIRRAAHARREIESRIQSHVHQTLSGVSVVQAFAREDDEQRRFEQNASVAIRTHQRSALVASLYGLGSGLLTTLGTAAIMWLAATRVLDGRLTIGVALVFLAYLVSLQRQLVVFASMYTTLQTAGASIDRVMEVFNEDERVPERPDARVLPPVRGDVVFDEVVFGYGPDRAVLRGLSLSVAAGETIAIVGETGAGKSTLASLIPRFFDPDAGRVMIDGHDLRTVTVDSLRRQVAVVLQESVLFPGSVAENIEFGRPGATRAQVEAAARAANAHEFITRLAAGYDTVIGERGATLSGGERQRIALARAFLKDAPILILDEPTSALDAETEHGIMHALEALMRGRTTIIVAHRLSTIRRADRIIVLEAGQSAAQGTHSQLVAREGTYRRLYRLQFEGDSAGSAA